MALRGIQEYIAIGVNNIAQVDDEGNIVSIEGNIFFYYVLVSVSPWKQTWYRQRDKVDFITLLLITFHWLIETMLDHVTVVFSYATAVVLNLKTQSVNI